MLCLILSEKGWGYEYKCSLRIQELEQSKSECKQTEEALRKSEEEYRTIFENTGTATVIVEENMIVSLANAKLVEMSGYSREEIE